MEFGDMSQLRKRGFIYSRGEEKRDHYRFFF